MPNRPKVGEILLKAGIIDDHQLKCAIGEQSRWGRRIGATLVKLGFVADTKIAIACKLGHILDIGFVLNLGEVLKCKHANDRLGIIQRFGHPVSAIFVG